jgi:lysophospholipase L1-like esterase
VSARALVRILVCLLLTLAALGALEGGARLWRGKSARGLEWLDYSEERGWRSRPNSRSSEYAAPREFDRDGFLTVDSPGLTPESRRGKRLVLLIGDSRTFGNGVRTDDTFGQVLERRLPGVEVINGAFPGYSSLQGLISLQADAPRLRPDIVVYSFDFNDRRYVLQPSDADGPDRFRRLARLDSRDRLVRSLALVDLVAGRATPGPDHRMARPLDLASVRPRVSEDDFRRNLEAAARYGADHGIQIIFLILNDNPAQSHGMEQGALALHAGRLGEAEDVLRAAVSTDNVYADAARLQLAMLYARTGRAQEAAAVRVSPRTFYSLTGGYPIVPGGDYRAIMREVAARLRVRLVDAGVEIDRAPDRYIDFCHFDREGHRIVADLLEPLLR